MLFRHDRPCQQYPRSYHTYFHHLDQISSLPQESLMSDRRASAMSPRSSITFQTVTVSTAADQGCHLVQHKANKQAAKSLTAQQNFDIPDIPCSEENITVEPPVSAGSERAGSV